jgi:hypothetical protein
MTDSDLRQLERPNSLGIKTGGATVALGCGCLSLMREGRFEIEWCPHHAKMHGTIVVRKADRVPEPTLH